MTQGDAAVPELFNNPGSFGDTIKLIMNTPTTALPPHAKRISLVLDWKVERNAP